MYHRLPRLDPRARAHWLCCARGRRIIDLVFSFYSPYLGKPFAILCGCCGSIFCCDPFHFPSRIQDVRPAASHLPHLGASASAAADHAGLGSSTSAPRLLGGAGAAPASMSPSRLNPLHGVASSGAYLPRGSVAALLSATSSSATALAALGPSVAAGGTAVLSSTLPSPYVPSPASLGAGGVRAGAASSASIGGSGRLRVEHGYYAGAFVSLAAHALLSVGHREARRIYNRGRLEAEGSAGVIFCGVGSNLSSETGTPILLGLAEGGASRTKRDESGNSGQTFIESLRLSLDALEAVARGEFVYLTPIRARGRAGIVCTDGAVVGHENLYDLRVVEHKRTNPQDYCTLSDAGIVHVSKKTVDWRARARSVIAGSRVRRGFAVAPGFKTAISARVGCLFGGALLCSLCSSRISYAPLPRHQHAANTHHRHTIVAVFWRGQRIHAARTV